MAINPGWRPRTCIYLGQPPTGALSEVIHLCQRNRGTREISYHPTKKITPLMGVL